MLIDCLSCYRRVDRQGCYGKEWYGPKEIQYCVHQIMWIIYNLPDLREGIYPRDPRVTGYTDPFGKSNVRNQTASHVIPCEIAAELRVRVSQCGVEGKLLLAETLLGQSFGCLSPEARTALYYCCGRRRKSTSYRQWIALRTQRKDRKYIS